MSQSSITPKKLFGKKKGESPPNAAPIVRKFGTFQGVFTPTVLTILGVIMFLRHTWVVGQAGVVGAILIVVLAVTITGCTALSMSSMTTNIRIGAGGAFSIISQSLGLEMGGSIGVPLYFSQACAVAMYVFGFREGWLSIFPEHAAYSLVVDFCTFGVVAGIATISTNFAFKIQNVMMVIIFGAIISIVLGLLSVDIAANADAIQLFGQFPGEFNPDSQSFEHKASFWVVFAVFFPAVTGVMAGANMSGDLENPRQNIPRGTLAAVVLTALIYLALIFVAALLATPAELTSSYNIFIDKSAWRPIVIAGLLGATFSSALGSFVGAPRILLALGQFNILPGSDHFKKMDKKGEPKNAMLFTAVVVLFSLLLRDLNAIAPLITMFFMITYAMINVVVLIEQSLGLPSFRPTLKVPIVIPFLGSLGCFFVMFIINSTVSFISLGIVIAFYAMLLRKDLSAGKGDARSGLFTALAEWATKKSGELSPKKEQRAWQPELLIPVQRASEIKGSFRLINAMAKPKGSVKILGMRGMSSATGMANKLEDLVSTFNKAGIASSYSVIDGRQYGEAVNISMQALGTAFFRPNTILLKYQESQEAEYPSIFNQSLKNDWAVTMYVPNDEVGLGIENTVNVWIKAIPKDWEAQLELGNNDLSLLLGLIVFKNWRKNDKNARLNIIQLVDAGSDLEEQELQLKRIKTLARLPQESEMSILEHDSEGEFWHKGPSADLHIMNYAFTDDSFEQMKAISKHLKASCLFTIDSNNENALV